MNKRRFLHTATAAALLAAGLQPASAQAVDTGAVVRQYAAIVFASYEDTHKGAVALQKAVAALVATPNADTLGAARKAWPAAREPYGQTEAYRFYSGPIDDAKGPEGQINAWPMDESYVDYVKGKPNAGIINKKVAITKASLAKANEHGGEENIATGWHAIDYVDGKTPNAERRRQYLTLVTELLVDDLEFLVKSWAPDARNYRAKFEKAGDESLRRMIVGIGSLSRGELAGERLEVALNTQDQEDEHSCFSDNTHRDVVNNAQGIQNVWLGSYKRVDGTVLSGPSLNDLVAARNPALADKTTQQIAASVAAANAIQAPFDREIVGANDAPGRLRVKKTVDALVQQSKDLVEAADAIGIKRLTLVQP